VVRIATVLNTSPAEGQQSSCKVVFVMHAPVVPKLQSCLIYKHIKFVTHSFLCPYYLSHHSYSCSQATRSYTHFSSLVESATLHHDRKVVMQNFHEVTMTFKTQLMKGVPLKHSWETLRVLASQVTSPTQNILRYNKIHFNFLPVCTAATAVKAIHKGLW
jgi:hypothetical protein